jgi:alpha-N-arabinofuranosidase
LNINIDTKKKHSISPYLFMQFMEPLGTADSSVDAGWDYLNNEWHPELVDTVKELEPTMIRFGGCFASYYRWKEGVGPRDSRIPMLNLCWDGIYSNQVGTHEIVDLCRKTNAEPLMAVNMESDGRMHWAYPKPGINRLGDAAEAAEWVDYCNNPDNALRIGNGIREPYNIKYWQIGNETSYDKNGFDCRTAAGKTLEFAKKMREADSNIKLIAWGDSGWAARMCETAGSEIDYIAFHHHFNSGLDDSPLYGTEYRKNPENTWRHLMNAYRSLENNIVRMRSEVAPYGKRLAITEGHFALPGRNRCEVLSSWGAGAAYARCLNAIERNSDIIDIATMADFFGNRWQVNAIILPTPMRTEKAYLQPVGEVMKLFRHHIGRYAVSADCPPDIDMTASISENGKKIYLHIVNTDRTQSKILNIDISGRPAANITAYEIASDPSTEITPLNTKVFNPAEIMIEGNTYTLPPAGVAALEIERNGDES